MEEDSDSISTSLPIIQEALEYLKMHYLWEQTIPPAKVFIQSKISKIIEGIVCIFRPQSGRNRENLTEPLLLNCEEYLEERFEDIKKLDRFISGQNKELFYWICLPPS